MPSSIGGTQFKKFELGLLALEQKYKSLIDLIFIYILTFVISFFFFLHHWFLFSSPRRLPEQVDFVLATDLWATLLPVEWLPTRISSPGFQVIYHGTLLFIALPSGELTKSPTIAASLLNRLYVWVAYLICDLSCIVNCNPLNVE